MYNSGTYYYYYYILYSGVLRGSATSSSVRTVCRVAVGVVVVWVNVPGRDAVCVPGDRQVTVSGCVDPVGRVYGVVVDGLVAGPCRIVGAQDRSEHSSAAGRVVVCDFRCPHVVRSC